MSESGETSPRRILSVSGGKDSTALLLWYWSRHCPIGIDVLGLENADQIRERIDGGWELLKELFGEGREVARVRKRR